MRFFRSLEIDNLKNELLHELYIHINMCRCVLVQQHSRMDRIHTRVHTRSQHNASTSLPIKPGVSV